MKRFWSTYYHRTVIGLLVLGLVVSCGPAGVGERGAPGDIGRANQRFITAPRLPHAAMTHALVSVEPRSRVAFRTDLERLGGRILSVPSAAWLEVALPTNQVAALSANPNLRSVIPAQATYLIPRGSEQAAVAQLPVEAVDENGQNITAEALKTIGVGNVTMSAVTGRDVVVAVIDTGVDPGHPDLQRTPLGERKLVDWVDFTGQGEPAERALRGFGTTPAEGDVFTTFSALPARDNIITSEGKVSVGGIKSISGVYRYGFLEVDKVGLSANAVGAQHLLVLVTDSQTAGKYDVAYIDTDHDNDLSDEIPLAPFRDSQRITAITQGSRQPPVTIAISDIVPDGRLINVAFDGNGHGTHVAGILGANGSHFRGVAPGAKIMVLKALGSNGEGSWDNISRAMIYAAENGANIINISIGGLAQLDQSLTAENELIRELWDTYGVLVVVAAGNNGPGLGTLRTPGDPDTSLTVGAYMTPSLWRLSYGFDVPTSGLWDFSAVGPRHDGSPGPNLVAPGIAYSTVPFSIDASGYQVLEGTSMAVPYVSGGAALLWEASRLNGYEPEPQDIKHALELGASPLDGYHFVEQGYGTENLGAAWQRLQVAQSAGLAATGRLSVSLTSTSMKPVRGLYARSGRIGSRVVQVQNNSTRRFSLQLPSVGGITADNTQLALPPGRKRRLYLSYPRTRQPGLSEILYQANDPTTFGADLTILNTFVSPELAPNRDGTLDVSGTLLANARRRVYVDIPDGTVTLSIQTRAPGRASRYRVHIVDPNGIEWVDSGPLQDAGDGTWTRQLNHPQAGVWEIVVQSLPDLSYYGLTNTPYALTLQVNALHPVVEEAHLHGTPGVDALTGTVSLQGYGKAFVGRLVTGSLTAVSGSAPGPLPRTVKQARVSASQPFFEDFTLANDASLVELVLENSTSTVVPALILYRYDASGTPVQVAEASSVDRGRVLRFNDLKAGKYLAWVETRSTAQVTVQYRRTVLYGTPQVSVSPANFVAAPGFDLPIKVSVPAPAARGSYRGYLAFIDEADSAILSFLPLDLSVGRPAVLLQARPVRSGSGSSTQFAQLLTINQSQKSPARVPIRVNGVEYESLNGTVRLPASGPGSLQLPWRVEYLDPDLGWQAQTVTPAWNWSLPPVEETIRDGQPAGLREKLRSELGSTP